MSNKLIWTKEYSVHIAELDEQHKEFFKLCNELLDLAEQESFTNEQAFIKVLRLGDYASYHLGTEEEFFAKTNYPDAPHHIEIHNQFRQTTKDFINKLREDGANTKELIKEISSFSSNWLADHILVVDKKYTEWLNEHGIK